MRVLIAVGLLAIAAVPLFGEDEWELVYPEYDPTKENIVLSSIGAKVREGQPNAYLIGSHSGYAILGVDDLSSETGIEWTLVKLPVSFAIYAVDVLNGQWIIGGPDGQIAIHNQPNPDSTEINDLKQYWTIHQLDSHVDVLDLACLGDTILALHAAEERQVTLSLGNLDLVQDVLVKDLRMSQDGGETWSLLEDYTATYGIEVFNDQFYIMNRGELITARLDPSRGGISFSTVWDLDKFEARAGLYLLDQKVDPFGNATMNGNRLYIKGTIYDRSDICEPRFCWTTHHSFYLSTSDGNEWFDHGSTFTRSDSTGLYHGFWNPLDLPEENRLGDFAEWPEVLSKSAQIAGNYGLGSSTLYHYNGSVTQEELIEMATDDMITGKFSDDTIAVWDKVVFYTEDNLIGILDRDEFRTFRIPFSGYPYSPYDWLATRRLTQIEGRYFVWANYLTPKNWIDETVYSTSNFIEFSNELTWTGWETGINDLDTVPIFWNKSCDNIIVIEKSIRGNYPIGWRVFKNGAWKKYSFLNLNHSISDAVYFSGLGMPVILYAMQEEVVLDVVNNSGELIPFVSFEVESWPGYFDSLACLDANTLITFGNCAEIAIIDSDGSVRLSHPWQLFPPDDYRIESVHFVNGWYYLVGSATLRTKDFYTYQKIVTPFENELVAVRRYGNYLLGFLEDAIFRQPLETGYLDSIQPYIGWHHTDWLGWFQIIDEELGDIDHLLLGKCWVKPVNELEYWIRTSTLGWIWMFKDWSPWFWRMDDGHWYWLDQDGWPPRAWDYEDQEWEELH